MNAAPGFSAFPRTHAVLAQGIRDGLHLGAQIYVARAGATLLDAAVGEARPGEPLTPDHLTLWLSAGKPLTALAVARAVERGRLAWDDPVARHLPEFAAGGKAALTLRHLLTHTGGFRAADQTPDTLPWAEYLARVCATPLAEGWRPGAMGGYQLQSSWAVLGEVVARAEGRPFPDLLRAEIFLPLGMNETWNGLPTKEFARLGPRVAGHFTCDPPGRAPAPFRDGAEAAARCQPGSNTRGPIRELGRFYEAMLGWRPAPVTPATLREMTSRQRAGVYDHTFRHVLDFGLGFIVNSRRQVPIGLTYGFGDFAGDDTFGHGGNQSSCAFADPEQQIVVAWVCNGMPGERRHQPRQRALNNAIYEDLQAL